MFLHKNVDYSKMNMLQLGCVIKLEGAKIEGSENVFIIPKGPSMSLELVIPKFSSKKSISVGCV